MTVRAARRRRSTLLAAAAVVVALLVTLGLAYAGAMALWNSTEGDEAAEGIPELAFPETPTALLAGVDDTGALASLSVLVLRPDGAGGSVVSLPVSADATAGEGDERLPIAETFALEGPDSLESEVEIALNLSFDVVEVATAERLAELLAPAAAVDVDLPVEVTDHDGDVVAAAGTSTLGPDELAAVLTARDPSLPAADQLPAASAVWAGLAVTVGEGPDDAPEPTDPPTVESVLAGATAGELHPWTLTSAPVDPARNPRGVDVALLDRAEVAMVFGQIAPGKVAAPNPGLSFRVVADFSAEQLGDREWSNADVAYRAVSQLLFLRANVISVDTTPATAPSATTLEVTDASTNTSGAEEVLGRVEVVEAEERIVGVDAVLRLGEAYLEFLDGVEAAQDGTVASVPSDQMETEGVEPVSADDVAATTTN